MISKLSDKINNMIHLTIKEIEEKYNINILFGSIIGSKSINLSNDTSDLDFYLIFENKCRNKYTKFNNEDNNDLINWLFPPDISIVSKQLVMDKTKNSKFKIDFVCFEISRVYDSVKEYSSKYKKFPTYFYRKGISDDDGQFIIFRILSSPYLWDNKYYVKKNYEELRSTFIKINILDYYFTRANGNYENYLKNLENVRVRKYLYTLHEIYCMKWILEHNTVPIIDFYTLLELNKCEDTICYVNELLKINIGEKVYSKDVLEVKANKKLNIYIKNEIDKIDNQIRKMSDDLEFDILIDLKDKK